MATDDRGVQIRYLCAPGAGSCPRSGDVRQSSGARHTPESVWPDCGAGGGMSILSDDVRALSSRRTYACIRWSPRRWPLDVDISETGQRVGEQVNRAPVDAGPLTAMGAHRTEIAQPSAESIGVAHAVVVRRDPSSSPRYQRRPGESPDLPSRVLRESRRWRASIACGLWRAEGYKDPINARAAGWSGACDGPCAPDFDQQDPGGDQADG